MQTRLQGQSDFNNINWSNTRGMILFEYILSWCKTCIDISRNRKLNYWTEQVHWNKQLRNPPVLRSDFVVHEKLWLSNWFNKKQKKIKKNVWHVHRWNPRTKNVFQPTQIIHSQAKQYQIGCAPLQSFLWVCMCVCVFWSWQTPPTSAFIIWSTRYKGKIRTIVFLRSSAIDTRRWRGTELLATQSNGHTHTDPSSELDVERSARRHILYEHRQCADEEWRRM